MIALLRDPAVTHVACAFDHVIESFRNKLFTGYKTGEGIEPQLFAQFELAERAVGTLGIVVWPMIEFEADDAIATFADRAMNDSTVERVVICSPDKDLCQCVRGERVVCLDRMRGRLFDDAGVIEKHGVLPTSIPDFLALVGDASDGIPGVARWGAKSAAIVLKRYGTIENIPPKHQDWDVTLRGAEVLSRNLQDRMEEALLFRRLATLRLDVPLAESVDDLRWRGPDEPTLRAIANELADDKLVAMTLAAWESKT
jgi:5'-3' exonuclease